MMQTHDLVVAVRAAEAKRRHIAFTQRCLALATKVQILRNRGYAMDTAEEELKKKLVELEKKAFDPILGGRQEEIWARMSAVRARASLLQEESEKMGKNLENGDAESLDEEGMKKVKKVGNSWPFLAVTKTDAVIDIGRLRLTALAS
jgi:nuclear pore complex protein Nup54